MASSFPAAADTGLVRSLSTRAFDFTQATLTRLNSVVRLPSYRSAVTSDSVVDMRAESSFPVNNSNAGAGTGLSRGLSVRAQRGTNRVEDIVRTPSPGSITTIHENPSEESLPEPPRYANSRQDEVEAAMINSGASDRSIIKSYDLFHSHSPYIVHTAAERFKTLVQNGKINQLTLSRAYLQNHPNEAVKDFVTRRLMPLVDVYRAQQFGGGYGVFKMRSLLFSCPALWENPNDKLKDAMRQTSLLFLENDALELHELEFLKQNAQTIPAVHQAAMLIEIPEFEEMEQQLSNTSSDLQQQPRSMSFMEQARSILPANTGYYGRSVLNVIRDVGQFMLGAGQRAVHELTQLMQPRVHVQADNDLRSFFGHQRDRSGSPRDLLM